MPIPKYMMRQTDQDEEKPKRKLPIDPMSAAFMAMMVGPAAFRFAGNKMTGDRLTAAVRSLFDQEMASGDPARANVDAIRAKASSEEFLRANKVWGAGKAQDVATGLPRAAVVVDEIAKSKGTTATPTEPKPKGVGDQLRE